MRPNTQKITMFKVILAFICSASIAFADPHLGAAVHFENQVGNPNYNTATLAPLLAKTPFMMIRDGDAPNWKKYEQTQGVYTDDPYNEQSWIDAMSAAGYSIVFCSGFDKTSTGSDYIPSFYPISPFPIQQYVAFITHFVQYQLSRGVHIAAIEVMNEPNNAFAAA